jgi:hypothetical protein
MRWHIQEAKRSEAGYPHKHTLNVFKTFSAEHEALNIQLTLLQKLSQMLVNSTFNSGTGTEASLAVL